MERLPSTNPTSYLFLWPTQDLSLGFPSVHGATGTFACFSSQTWSMLVMLGLGVRQVLALSCVTLGKSLPFPELCCVVSGSPTSIPGWFASWVFC